MAHEAGSVSNTQVQQPTPPSLAVREAGAVKELEAQLPTSPSLAVEEAEAVDGTEEQAQGQHSTSLALTEEQELRGSTSYSVTNDAKIASEVDSGQEQQRSLSQVHTVEEQLNASSKKTSTRKRKRNPDQWKRNIRKAKKPREKHTSIVLALPYQLRESFPLSANAASNVQKLSMMTLDLKYVQSIMH